MKLLAVETSTEYCSVALWLDGLVHERCELVGQKHSELLIGMIDALLKDAGLAVKQLDGIAFGKGPGSFTGVRIACGVAQGLAFGANLEVVGVCTLEALAEASGQDRVIAALDARMGELYLAAYQKQADGWQSVVEPCLCKAESAPAVSGEGWFGTGSGFASSASAPDGMGGLAQKYAAQLIGLDEKAVPQAAAIVRIGARAFAQGQAVDAALALPFYLRDKVALTTREREAAKG